MLSVSSSSDKLQPSLPRSLSTNSLQMSQFLFFGGDPKAGLKKKIDFSGKAKGKEELLAQIQRERQAREHQKQLISSASLVQRQIQTKTHSLRIREELIQFLFEKASELSSCVKEHQKFLSIFRAAVFAGQLIPEHLLMEAIKSFDGSNASFPFLLAKYCAAHAKELENAEYFCNFFLQWEDLLVGMERTVECTFASRHLSLEFMVKFLKESKKYSCRSFYFVLFEVLFDESKQTSYSHESFACLSSFFDMKCLIFLLEFSQNHPLVRKIMHLLPPFIQNSNVSFAQKMQLLSAFNASKVPFTFENFSFLLSNEAPQECFAAYAGLLMEFVSFQILSCSNNYDSSALKACTGDLEWTEKISRFCLPEIFHFPLWHSLSQVEKIFGRVKQLESFLNSFIRVEIGNLMLHVEVFSLFFLSAYFWRTFGSPTGNPAIERETVEIFLRKLRRFYQFLKEGSMKAAIFGVFSFLDRENSIREFAGLPLLFPPAATTVHTSCDDSLRVMEIPILFPFEARIAFLADKLEYNTSLHDMRRGKTITVRREHEFEDSVPFLSDIRLNSFVKYAEETGFGYGVVKEYVVNALVQAFSLEQKLFFQVADNTLYPSGVANSFTKFELAGRLTGLAVVFGLTVQLKTKINFAFFTQLVKERKCIFEDLAFVDEELHRNLKFLSNNDSTDLCLFFSITARDENGAIREIDLIPGGKAVPVTEQNKDQFIRLAGERRLNRDNVLAFLRGFNAIVDDSLIRIFNEPELCTLLTGREEGIVIQEWKAHTVFRGASSPESIEYFWQAVERLTPSERTDLMKFVTGFSRPPVMGFESLQPNFTVEFTADHLDLLPTSHTCFNLIVIPCYPNEEIFYEKLKLAVAGGAGGFFLA